jgi:ubiquinol-cytochrome c reductase cytochrome c subunit
VIRRWVRRGALAGALACLAGATLSAAAGGQDPVAAPGPQATATGAAMVSRGRVLFAQGCAVCHGTDLRGRPGMGPSLRGVGTAAADFYLSTGRMPLENPTDQPVRAEPAYDRAEIAALVAFVGSFGGPAPPDVRSARGDVARGLKAFTDHCAGCHPVVARGGIVTGAAVPALDKATDRQLGEAVRVGPYVMPAFGERLVDARTLDDLAAYVRYAKDPDDAGGWPIGNIGPIPEGMVAWLLGGVVLLGVARVIGERSER